MKKIKNYAGLIVLLGLMFPCFPVMSQNLEVTYSETLKFKFNDHGDDPEMEQLRKSGTTSKTLVYSGGKSLYSDRSNVTNSEMAYILSGEITVNVFKDQKNRLMIKELDLYTRHFLIRTEGVSFTWKIETDYKKIGNYLCRKAVCVLDTMPVIAWYAEEITVSDGPDVFWGLPGLILEINLGNDERIITAQKVLFTKTGAAIVPPVNGKEAQEDEYNKIKTRKFAEMKAGGGKIQHVQSLKVD